MKRDDYIDTFVSNVRNNTPYSLEVAIEILGSKKDTLISNLSTEELMEVYSKLYEKYVKLAYRPLGEPRLSAKKELEKSLRWKMLEKYMQALNESSSEHAKNLIKFVTRYSDINSPRILGPA